MKLCTVCKENVAVIFLSKLENGKPVSEALCIECAHKKHIPGIEQMIKDTGMSIDQIKNMTAGMNDILGDMDLDNMESPEQMMQFLSGEQMNEDSLDEIEDEDEIVIVEDSESEVEPKKKKKKKTKKPKRKNLETYGLNLTEKAKNLEVDRIIGRN